MSENTHLAEQEESATRIAELSGALETLRENHQQDMNAMWRELETRTAQLSEATATIDRLRLHLSQGVEL